MSKTVALGTVFKGSESGKIVAAEGDNAVPVGAQDCVVNIIAGGLCGTDCHMRKRPDMVLGHEPVGVISQAGSDVTLFKVGDRVGWGYNTGACLNCTQCLQGYDTQCSARKMYGSANKHQGGFGDKAVIPQAFLHRIPDELSLEDASCLQCGGTTVFAALKNADVRPWDRVGVLGLGGLGHLAVQYANKMGCHVTVFSRTDNKKEEALKLGAHSFVATKDQADLSKAGIEPVHHLIVCTSALPDWKQFLPILAPRASVVPLSVDEGDFRLANMALIGKELRTIGSLVADRFTHKLMLEFTARHGIKPMLEIMDMTEENLNVGIDRLEKGDVRYRFVFTNKKNKQLANGSA